MSFWGAVLLLSHLSVLKAERSRLTSVCFLFPENSTLPWIGQNLTFPRFRNHLLK